MKEFLLQITMWIVTICTFASYVPQLYKLIQTKKSEDLSVTSWILWTVSGFANVTYSIVLGRYELIIASISECALILSTLLLTIYYNKRCLYILSDYNYAHSNSYCRYYDTSCGHKNVDYPVTPPLQVNVVKPRKCKYCGRKIILKKLYKRNINK